MKIVVIDNFPILRSGITTFLKEHFPNATLLETGTISSFSEQVHKVKVDLFILGISESSNTDNLATIDQIRKMHPDSKFIGYDEKPEAGRILSYMNSGTSGYISKHAELTELKKCIREVLEGRKFISQDIISLLINHKERTDDTQIRYLKRTRLTAHEYEIAKYLSEGMKTGWIATLLNRKASTISTIKSTIYKKLEVDNIVTLREEISRVLIKSQRQVLYGRME